MGEHWVLLVTLQLLAAAVVLDAAETDAPVPCESALVDVNTLALGAAAVAIFLALDAVVAKFLALGVAVAKFLALGVAAAISLVVLGAAVEVNDLALDAAVLGILVVG